MRNEMRAFIQLQVGIYSYFYPVSELPNLPAIIARIDKGCYRVNEGHVKIDLLASDCLTDFFLFDTKYTQDDIISKKSFTRIKFIGNNYDIKGLL